MNDSTRANPSVVDVRERSEKWLAITLAPLVWLTHFFASYLTNAIYCAKFASESGDAMLVRNAIFAYTSIALPLIALIGWYHFRRHRYGHRALPHDADSREDRYRFVGYAGYLLSILCAIAVVFTALVAVFLGSCD